MGDDKPFCCTSSGCGMCFTNEDHLTVHLKKHEMSLSLNAENGSSKVSNFGLFVDQTPTPTRFIRNCEEVGLFQDLQNVNPFEEHFRKAVEATKAGLLPVVESGRSIEDADILHTPAVLAADLEANRCRVDCEVVTVLDSPIPTVGVGSMMSDKEVMFCDSVTNDDENACNVTSSSLADCKTNSGSKITETISFCGDSEDVSILPTTESLVTTSVVTSTTLSSVPTDISSTITESTQSLSAAVSSTVPSTNTAAVVQLILKLPDGRSIPVSIPTVPVVGTFPSLSASDSAVGKDVSLSHTVSTSVVAVPKSTASVSSVAVINNSQPSFVKQRLREVLTSNQVAVANTLAVVSESSIPADSSFLSVVDTLNNNGNFLQAQKKRRSGEDDSDEKRKRFLERNRAAATRCRQKRKHWVQNLENKADELSVINQQLQNEVTMLRNEVSQLKSMLLAHKDCPVTQEQQRNQKQLATSSATTFIIQKSDSSDVFEITPAEAIASTALTNLSQASDEHVVFPTLIDNEQVFVSTSVPANTMVKTWNGKGPNDLVVFNIAVKDIQSDETKEED